MLLLEVIHTVFCFPNFIDKSEFYGAQFAIKEVGTTIIKRKIIVQ